MSSKSSKVKSNKGTKPNKTKSRRVKKSKKEVLPSTTFISLIPGLLRGVGY